MLILTVCLSGLHLFEKILFFPISFRVHNINCFAETMDSIIIFIIKLLKIKFKNLQLFLASKVDHKMNFEQILNKANFEVIL